MDILRALSSRQKTLFHKRPSRAELSARVSFFLCLSESVAQAFRGSKFHMQPRRRDNQHRSLFLSLVSPLFPFFQSFSDPRCFSLFPSLSREREPQLTKATSPLVIRHAAVTVSSLFFVEKKKKTDNPIRTLFFLSLLASRPELMIIPFDTAGLEIVSESISLRGNEVSRPLLTLDRASSRPYAHRHLDQPLRVHPSISTPLPPSFVSRRRVIPPRLSPLFFSRNCNMRARAVFARPTPVTHRGRVAAQQPLGESGRRSVGSIGLNPN